MTSNFDCVVIGAGIAGMTAAIYLKRANLNVVMIEKSAPGGQINRSSHISNYPGFTDIDGPSFAMQLFEQTQNLEIPYQYGNVLSIDTSCELKKVVTDQEEIICKSVIIASGRSPRELGLSNERQLTGKGISWCAVCDGFFYKDKEVAVIGGGNSALEESLYLSELCKKVYLIHRRDSFRGDAILSDKVKEKANIEIYYNTIVKEAKEKEGRLSSLVLDSDGKTTDLSVSGLFIYVGYSPDTDFLNDSKVEMDNGYVITSEEGRTNIPFVYACGDVRKKSLYQLTTAVGEAAQAATSAIKDMNIKYS